mgnify:CR=1 FL=1
MLIQSCQDAAPNTEEQLAAKHNPKQELEFELKREDSILLLATSRGSKAVRGKLTGYMDDEFRSANVHKDIV